MSNLTHLRAPFPADRVEWRIQSCGTKNDGSVWARCLAYIDNRAAMERLDEVYGEGWSHKEEFKQIGSSAVCTVTLTCGDRTVCGSCEVELAKGDDIDPFKSAASGAMKRAVVNLGIGRYLYELPEAWAVITDSGKYQGKTKDGTKFKWNPPDLDAPIENFSSQVAIDHLMPRTPIHGSEATRTQNVRPAPNVYPVGEGDWKSVIIPFGKQQGKSLGSLPAASLKWWQDNYQPKPYKGAISAKDKAFRDALDQSLGVTSAPATEAPDDDVPF